MSGDVWLGLVKSGGVDPWFGPGSCRTSPSMEVQPWQPGLPSTR